MRFVSWGVVAACGFLLAGPAARAADLRIPDLPSPQYNWTGFYAGVYGGGAYAAWAADYCRNGACRQLERVISCKEPGDIFHRQGGSLSNRGTTTYRFLEKRRACLPGPGVFRGRRLVLAS